MNKSIADIRQEYRLASLNETDLDTNPILQFQKWFQEAINADISDVNAMALTTVDIHSKPHSRIVLLKGIEENSFQFYTNYQSHKGKQIENNPHVSLVFFWKELQRQVRVEGIVQKTSEENSINYFHSRPRESQFGAWASLQSEPLENRSVLEKRYQELEEKYKGIEIPKPPHWGGFAIQPNLIEFWQGRMSRLHDRFVYSLHGIDWKLERLNP